MAAADGGDGGGGGDDGVVDDGDDGDGGGSDMVAGYRSPSEVCAASFRQAWTVQAGMNGVTATATSTMAMMTAL